MHSMVWSLTEVYLFLQSHWDSEAAMASPGTSELEALLVKHLTGAVDKVEKRLEEKFASWVAQAFEGVNYDETEEQEEWTSVIDIEESQAGTSGCSEGLKAVDQEVDETKLGDQGGFHHREVEGKVQEGG